ncbi:restriction endonuclease subunit S [Streptomyces sp. NPDC088115]|uniref:restriction endonuclease subunit S n=1 Tax=unclassified Streptomyces TaxID=2593676 RepID=UPI0037F15A64
MIGFKEFIASACPGDFTTKTLGDLFDMKAGVHVSASKISDVTSSETPYPCYGANGHRGYVSTYSHDGEYLLIGRQGALCGNMTRTSGKFYATEHAVVTKACEEVNIDWAYHKLTAMNLNQYATKSAQPGISVGKIKQVAISVPPISVQREVALLLDSFTSLQEQLEESLAAELEARLHQYAHHRDALLTFPEGGQVNWTTLGEIGEFIRGRRFTKNDYVESGLGCIHYGQIYTDYGTAADTTITFLDPGLRGSLRFARKGDLVIAATGENVEDICKAVAWLGEEEVAVHDDCYIFRHSLDPKFAAYLFQSSAFQEQKAKYVNEAKIARMSGANVAKIRVQIPPLAQQKHVVAALDKFDDLITSLSAGLAAEIAARRQQYAYYHDRLLSFEEKKAA